MKIANLALNLFINHLFHLTSYHTYSIMKIPTLEQLDNNQPLIQLGLLNFALMIILIKDIGFLFSIFSFALIFVVVSLVYHHVLRHGKP